MNTGQADPGCYGESHLSLYFYCEETVKCAVHALDFLFQALFFNSVITFYMKSYKSNKKQR